MLFRMSIICKSSFGYVIDQNRGVKECYGNVFIDDATSKCMHLRRELFAIETPFMMDSQFAALQTRSSENPVQEKKRKRKSEFNIGEERFQIYHSNICRIIINAYEVLLKSARHKHYLTKRDSFDHSINDDLKSDSSSPDADLKNEQFCSKSFSELKSSRTSAGGENKTDLCNNRRARNLAESIVGPRCTLLDLCDTSLSTSVPVDDSEIQIFRLSEDMLKFNHDPVKHLYQNHCGQAAVVSFNGDQYIIPDKSSFLMTDFSQINTLWHHNETDVNACINKYDLIVMDPPWENKSVKRKKKYKYLSNEDLFKIPLRYLATEEALIVVWVTNRMKHIDFVKDHLFPSWSVQYITEWFWLKVTTSGEMVFDIRSNHKKPYEVIIIGRYQSTSAKLNDQKEIPAHQTIISVPSALHSMKPPLNDILKDYIPAGAKCLELFARNLWPGWTSWGNEVLLHQHVDFYESMEKPSKEEVLSD